MYRILVGNHVVYDTQNKDAYPVSSPGLHLAVKDAGSLDFTAHSDHPYYDEIKTPLSFVTVYRDSDEIFYGRIIDYTKDIFGSLQVHCEGATTFLIDSEQAKLAKTKETVTAFFTRCINAHNAQVETAKQFTIGTVSVEKANTQQDFEISKFQKTKDTIESQLINRFGGFLRVRPNANGPHYIDYIESYNHTNNQLIQIGHNIIDKSDKVSGESIFTIFRPIGKNDITIGTLSQSDVQIPNCTKDGDTLRLTDLISEYGSIIDTKSFDTISDKTALLREAESYITKRRSHLPATSDIKFVDFYHLNPSITAVSVGDSFSNIESFSGQTMIVSELELDLEDSSNDSIFFQNLEEFENLGKGNYTSVSSGSRGGGGSGYAGQMFEHISDVDDKVTITAKETQIIGEQVTLHASELLQLSGEVTQITGGHIGIVSGMFTVDDQGNLKLEDGAALQVSKNGIYSDVVDQNGMESAIEQTQSYIRQVVGVKTQTYVSYDDPASAPSAEIHDGDIWHKSNGTETWEQLNELDWSEAYTYNWQEYLGGISYIRKNGKWVEISNEQAVALNTQGITETDKAIRLAKADSDNNFANLLVTASLIRSEVKDTKAGLTSTIQQTASQIRMEVDSKTDTAKIVLGINSQDGSFVKIQANKINLSGYVTATELSATNAKIQNLESDNATFSNLLTGQEQAGYIRVATLRAGAITFGSYSLRRGYITVDGTQFQVVMWGS